MSQHPTYIFAGGGTGGHIAPALAVAEQVRQLRPEADVLIACTEREIDRRMLEPSGYAFVPQPVRPIPRSPLRWPRFYLTWRRSLRFARDLLAERRPAAVLGLGGFAAGPAVRVAAERGLPTALLNPDAIPGKANRYLARRVGTIFTQFEVTTGHFGEEGDKCRPVGCPIRADLLGVERRGAVEGLGLDPARRTLVVMGGSLGAQTINEAALSNVTLLAARSARWQVLHISGPGKAGEAREAYEAADVPHVVMEFCDTMGLVYAAADLVIGRAGANTIAELMATGTPAVLLPYPFHRDQHQRHNAAAMVDAGAAVLVEDQVDPAGNAAVVRDALEPLLTDVGHLERMAAAAHSLARPNAARAVAEWLVGVVN